MDERESIRRAAEESLRRGLADAARAAEVVAQVSTLRGTGEDAHRAAHVTVDHRGIVQEVRIRDGAARLGTGGLRDAVLGATRAAVADVQAQAAPLRSGLVPPDLTDTSLLDRAEELLRGTRASAPRGGTDHV